ncbi:MAG: hypothetical protein M0Q21_08985 [Ignavibacteriaceae bacterium]|nr:hypothetical protein [Ignavibacteriaceae bacterium]
MKKVFVLLFLFAVCVFADNIHMKNGRIFFNVRIIKTTDNMIEFQFNNLTKAVLLVDVLKIDTVPYNPSNITVIGDSLTDFEAQMKQNLQQKRTQLFQKQKNQIVEVQQKLYIQLSTPLILTAALAGLMSINYFLETSDISDNIEQIKNLKMDTSGLERKKTRMLLSGVATMIISLAAIAISSQDFEIDATPSSLSVSYNF